MQKINIYEINALVRKWINTLEAAPQSTLFSFTGKKINIFTMYPNLWLDEDGDIKSFINSDIAKLCVSHGIPAGAISIGVFEALPVISEEAEEYYFETKRAIWLEEEW